MSALARSDRRPDRGGRSFGGARGRLPGHPCDFGLLLAAATLTRLALVYDRPRC